MPTINGQFTYTTSSGTAIVDKPNYKFTLHTSINGQALPTDQLTDNDFRKYTLNSVRYDPNEVSALQEGKENVLTYWLTDDLGNSSNEITVKIYVISGELELSTSAATNFEAGLLSGKRQYLKRDTSDIKDWQIVVNDGRPIIDGTTTTPSWYVYAKANKFFTSVSDGSKELKGRVVIQNSQNSDLTDLTNADALIESGDTPTSQTERSITIDTSQIALQVDANATKGVYNGAITWTLANTPQ